jgi:hypothetical protein
MNDINKLKEFFLSRRATTTAYESLNEVKEIELNDKQKKYLKSILNNRYGKGAELGYIDNGVGEFIERVKLDISKEEFQDLLDKDILKIRTKPGKKPYKALFLSKDLNKMNLTEAEEEDAVDTITMDVPLFIRMLEYAREDAAADVDLHDVTEKAIALNKEKGILSMEDYSDIVGASEDTPKDEIKEMDYGSILMKNLMPKDDILKRYVDILVQDPKIASATSEQEFRGLLRDKVEKAHYFGNKDEVSRAAEYILSLNNNADKYSNTMTRVYNMVKEKPSLDEIAKKILNKLKK